MHVEKAPRCDKNKYVKIVWFEMECYLHDMRLEFVKCIHRKYLAHSLCEKVFISYDPHSQNKVNS